MILRLSLVSLLCASVLAHAVNVPATTGAPAAVAPPVPRKPFGWNMTIDRIPKDLKVEDNIVYKTVDGQDLKLTAFYPKVRKYAKAPLLVYIHGGGWGAGNRFVVITSGGIDVVRKLNEAGVVCVSIEYRLLDRSKPGLTSIDQEADCRDAVHFMVKNAARFGIDPARIATMGGSAGGHLSLVTALGEDRDYPCDPGLAAYPGKVLAEAAQFPLVSTIDPAVLKDSIVGSNSNIERLMGGPAAQHPNEARKLSPALLLKPDSPALILIHGNMDRVLNVQNSITLAALCRQKAVPCELIVVKNADHGFRPAVPPTPIDPSQDEINDRTAAFLLKYLLPPGK